jgi:hypothetical protein
MILELIKIQIEGLLFMEAICGQIVTDALPGSRQREPIAKQLNIKLLP